MDLISLFLPVFSLALLCAGWVVVQLLARRMGTKNHIDNAGTGCGQCGCGDSCRNSNVSSVYKTNENHV